MILKVGLDIHGCIDTYPEEFSHLSKHIWNGGGEVHIITGLIQDAEVEETLYNYNIHYTHYFSIVDYLVEKGVQVDWRVNSSGVSLPYAPEDDWNNAKRDYCELKGIHFMLDDSPTYKGTFNEIDTTYLHVINPKREVYTVR